MGTEASDESLCFLSHKSEFFMKLQRGSDAAFMPHRQPPGVTDR